jgi:hypothetical protein
MKERRTHELVNGKVQEGGRRDLMNMFGCQTRIQMNKQVKKQVVEFEDVDKRARMQGDWGSVPLSGRLSKGIGDGQYTVGLLKERSHRW